MIMASEIRLSHVQRRVFILKKEKKKNKKNKKKKKKMEKIAVWPISVY